MLAVVACRRTLLRDLNARRHVRRGRHLRLLLRLRWWWWARGAHTAPGQWRVTTMAAATTTTVATAKPDVAAPRHHRLPHTQRSLHLLLLARLPQGCDFTPPHGQLGLEGAAAGVVLGLHRSLVGHAALQAQQLRRVGGVRRAARVTAAVVKGDGEGCTTLPLRHTRLPAALLTDEEVGLAKLHLLRQARSAATARLRSAVTCSSLLLPLFCMTTTALVVVLGVPGVAAAAVALLHGRSVAVPAGAASLTTAPQPLLLRLTTRGAATRGRVAR